ncbi:MAG: hypothetical protein COC20_01165 [Cellvibrionales bacterium]|nr:MAG: hypothetical protein COC20_01165 [Cellvibrionales bacterium]
MQYNFEWEPAKAQANAQKHGVTFEEATRVFKDPMALTVFDGDHSGEEDRWITLGNVGGQCYVVVVHTYRNEVENMVTMRLISARLATKHEIKQYEG